MEERGVGDDILIIRQGLITDTSYCNILFFDGVRWVTPDEPLLRGTKRTALIEHGNVFPLRIAYGDLNYFSHFMLVNALLDFDVSRAIDISGILR
jgi:4-amino-4-deoxychorismate lyase